MRRNYDLIYLSRTYTEKYDAADAIVAYDISKNIFIRSATTISVRFLPDCRIGDPLFLKSIPIMHRWQPSARSFPANSCFLSRHVKTPGKILRHRHVSGSTLCKLPFGTGTVFPENLLVTDHTLYEALASTANVCYLPSFSARKFQALFDCMNGALRREPLQQHAIAVS